jgi:hypothetical protein
MTLCAKTGTLIARGILTLNAGSGMVIRDTFTATGSATPLYINADTDGATAAGGTLTVQTAKVITTNNNHLYITTYDIDLDGSITSGTVGVKLHGSTSQTIGVGATAKSMHLERNELQRITSAGLTVGSAVSSDMTVTDVQLDNIQYITDVMTLVATVDNAKVTFATKGSTFATLAVQADNGVAVNKKITTTTGALHLEGDFDNANADDSTNTVAFADQMTMLAATVLTVAAQTGTGITAAGALTLLANNGISIQDTFTGSATASKPLVMNADSDSNAANAQSGVLTVQTGKTMTSTNNAVTITAYDIDLDGSLAAGTAAVVIHGAVAGQTIGVGASPVTCDGSTDVKM